MPEQLVIMSYFLSSSLSQWVHACDALQLPAQQREQLDSFIDQLYKDIEKGQDLFSLSLIFRLVGLISADLSRLY